VDQRTSPNFQVVFFPCFAAPESTGFAVLLIPPSPFHDVFFCVFSRVVWFVGLGLPLSRAVI